jgi:hypothetical protein
MRPAPAAQLQETAAIQQGLLGRTNITLMRVFDAVHSPSHPSMPLSNSSSMSRRSLRAAPSGPHKRHDQVATSGLLRIAAQPRSAPADPLGAAEKRSDP